MVLASLFRLLLLGGWGSLCTCWTPAALEAGREGSSSLARAPTGGWSHPMGPAVRFESSLVAKSVGKGIGQGPV